MRTIKRLPPTLPPTIKVRFASDLLLLSLLLWNAAEGELLKASALTIDTFMDPPMLVMLLLITLVKISLETTEPCEISDGRLKQKANMAFLGSLGDCLGYPGKIWTILGEKTISEDSLRRDLKQRQVKKTEQPSRISLWNTDPNIVLSTLRLCKLSKPQISKTARDWMTKKWLKA